MSRNASRAQLPWVLLCGMIFLFLWYQWPGKGEPEYSADAGSYPTAPQQQAQQQQPQPPPTPAAAAPLPPPQQQQEQQQQQQQQQQQAEPAFPAPVAADPGMIALDPVKNYAPPPAVSEVDTALPPPGAAFAPDTPPAPVSNVGGLAPPPPESTAPFGTAIQSDPVPSTPLQPELMGAPPAQGASPVAPARASPERPPHVRPQYEVLAGERTIGEPMPMDPMEFARECVQMQGDTPSFSYPADAKEHFLDLHQKYAQLRGSFEIAANQPLWTGIETIFTLPNLLRLSGHASLDGIELKDAFGVYVPLFFEWTLLHE